MQLFSRIPDRFFSILASSKKELYVQALFVLRQAFKTELVIRREELVAMLMDSLETEMTEADFSEETEDGDSPESTSNLSGKAHLLLRRLKETGWIETEYEARSFEENITIPDYAVSVINLLYDLTADRVREYNSYVYATYAALANAADNPDYLYQALQTAYQNTVRLIDELKTLFNNIRRYYRRIPGDNDVNSLLREHFDEYKAKVFDVVYYPLKTIDSIPRFKHAIISKINEWLLDEKVQDAIVSQGVMRQVFENEDDGRTQMFMMMNYVADTYDGIEEMMEEIDRKHTEYINASVDHIRYLMNSDRGIKGKLIELLKNSEKEEVAAAMSENLKVYRHGFYDEKSLYAKAARTRRETGPPLVLAAQDEVRDRKAVESFLDGVRKQYTNDKVDSYILDLFGERDTFSTEEVSIRGTEDFIMFLLGTIRGRERSAPFKTEFLEGNISCGGYSLPRTVFKKKSAVGGS